MGPNVTIKTGHFFILLKSKLTQYDQRLGASEMKRGGRANIYRIGHYLESAHSVEEDVADCVQQDATPECLSRVKKSLCEHFVCDPFTGEAGLSPVRNTMKQIDAFLTTGKKPSLVRR